MVINVMATLSAMPKRFDTALKLIRNKRKIQAYHDDLIGKDGIIKINLIYPKNINELYYRAMIISSTDETLIPRFISRLELKCDEDTLKERGLDKMILKNYLIKILKRFNFDENDFQYYFNFCEI